MLSDSYFTFLKLGINISQVKEIIIQNMCLTDFNKNLSDGDLHYISSGDYFIESFNKVETFTFKKYKISLCELSNSVEMFCYKNPARFLTWICSLYYDQNIENYSKEAYLVSNILLRSWLDRSEYIFSEKNISSCIKE